MHLKIMHHIESSAGDFVCTVRQDPDGFGRWEIVDQQGSVIASSNDEQLALAQAKRTVLQLDIARLEQIRESDARIAILLEMLNEELAELTEQAVALRN